MGPVGARCRDCLSNRDSHMYQVGAPQFIVAFGAAAILGAIGAVLINLLGTLALLALFYAPALGPILGKLVTRLTKGKRGPRLAAVTGAGVAIGALSVGAFTGAIVNPLLWIMVGIAIVGVWLFLR